MEQNNKTLLIGGGVILAIALVLFFVNKGDDTVSSVESGNVDSAVTATETPGSAKPTQTTTTTSRPTMTKDGSYLVSYENSGFKPKTMEISRGKSVRFVNNSTRAMRIITTDTTGSALYQALNQSKTVGKGGIYDYTFNEAGVFGFMNQNNTNDRGTITVK